MNINETTQNLECAMTTQTFSPPRPWEPVALDIVLVALIAAAILVPCWLAARDNPTRHASAVEVHVTDDTQLLINNRQVARASLTEHLMRLREETPDSRVVVRTDRSVRFSRVRSVLAECEGLGFASVSLQADAMPLD